MKTLLRTLALLMAIFVISPAIGADKPAAGKMVQVIPDKKADLVPYWLYLPKEYDANKDKLPVVLFLHGMGERGDNLKRVAAHGPPKLIAKGKHFPFIMIAPQCPNDGNLRDKKADPKPKEFWWKPGSIDKVKNIIDFEKKRLGRIDDDRVYVTGLSMGGFGCYNIVNRHPKIFAAAAPICGHGNGWPDKKGVVHIPFWAFHGSKDNVVKLVDQQKTVDALKAAGAKVKFTIYEGVGHNSWTKAYNDPELYKWLLAQKRKPAKK
jgi:predicted peptidase